MVYVNTATHAKIEFIYLSVLHLRDPPLPPPHHTPTNTLTHMSVTATHWPCTMPGSQLMLLYTVLSAVATLQVLPYSCCSAAVALYIYCRATGAQQQLPYSNYCTIQLLAGRWSRTLLTFNLIFTALGCYVYTGEWSCTYVKTTRLQRERGPPVMHIIRKLSGPNKRRTLFLHLQYEYQFKHNLKPIIT